jgi:hypothetical protein
LVLVSELEARRLEWPRFALPGVKLRKVIRVLIDGLAEKKKNDAGILIGRKRKEQYGGLFP